MAPRQWEVLPREQLILREMEFWGGQTPIGMIFWIGSLMGFAVGVIICYQILFTSIHDSMSEYATLKAMGYPNRFFVALVVRQSVYLSLIGFVPAMAVSFILFQVLESLAGLPMLITPGRALVVLGLTVTMCFASGLLALRKLVRADPASLF
jgi:putative ABC transport system permease protein